VTNIKGDNPYPKMYNTRVVIYWGTTLTVLHLAVESFTACDGARYWLNLQFLPTPPTFYAPLGGSLRNIAISFGVEKLEYNIVWLPDGVKSLRRYDYSFRQNPRTWQTDRQTDRQTPRNGIGRVCIASRGKNEYIPKERMDLNAATESVTPTS